MDKGFFTKKQTESKSRPDGKTYSCVSCGLYKQCDSPKMKPFGNFKKRILNIGEAPGKAEDATGKPWQGQTGRALKMAYKEQGIDLFEDCLNINAILCHPTDDKGNNKMPTNYEIDCCRKSILEVISKYEPHIIVLFGSSAIYSLLKHRWKKNLGGVMKWRGFTIPDKDFNAWICPTFHPSFVERAEKEIETVWLQDLERIKELIRTPLPTYLIPKIEIINDLSVLKEIKSDTIAFDYETTGIKPYAKNHRVICASVADSYYHAYAFMMPQTKIERRPFLELLENPEIGKMAHNMKFEDAWSVVRLRQKVVGWEWDSMIAAHILDNRPGITGLKFQTYVNFGVVDYDSSISPYLQGVGNEGGNAMNRIQDLINTPEGEESLLKYCALDSIYQYRLAIKQQKEMDYQDLPF